MSADINPRTAAALKWAGIGAAAYLAVYLLGAVLLIDFPSEYALSWSDPLDWLILLPGYVLYAALHVAMFPLGLLAWQGQAPFVLWLLGIAADGAIAGAVFGNLKASRRRAAV